MRLLSGIRLPIITPYSSIDDPVVDSYGGAPSEKSYIAYAAYTFEEDWTQEDINALYDLYYAGQNGLGWTPFEINNLIWSYADTTYSGHSVGDRWVEGDIHYIYLGAGLEGVSAIPEPSSILLMLLAVFGLLRKKLRV